MRKLDLNADELVRGLLKLSETEHVSILDSCGVGHLGSHLLIAGIRPVDIVELSGNDSERTLSRLDSLVKGPHATVFTLSYDFGAKLIGIPGSKRDCSEPDVFAALFDGLILHDYNTHETALVGRDPSELISEIDAAGQAFQGSPRTARAVASANFTRGDYLTTIAAIQERIRAGDTYQTNLTQQITAEMSNRTPQDVFWRLRRDHPSPFAAFIRENESTVVSASPERFFRIQNGRIETSPIKGTRRRGGTPAEDVTLKHDLVTSRKDRAENTMIVDLLRNDLGRVCAYGSVRVDKLCDVEEHPTLFHLVSTVSGDLLEDATFADVIRALLPCGSITGAPKISTMRIIDELEPTPRGLSMGAIGYSIPHGFDGLDPVIDLSVAIRTAVIRDGIATFNVGGGITIDSDGEEEYDESLLKAKALLTALNAVLDQAQALKHS